jgi:hypothetical protein
MRFNDEISVIPPPKVEKVFSVRSVQDVVTEQVPSTEGEVFQMLNPVCQYLQVNPGAQVKVIVRALFMTLKSVMPIVNEVKKVKCILDIGSSIVSMSKDTMVELGIVWNLK